MATARLITAELSNSIPQPELDVQAVFTVVDITLRKVALSRKSISTGEFGMLQYVGLSVVRTYP